MPGDTIARDEPTYHLRTVARSSGRASAIAFGALLVAAGAWLMYETRGTTLWFDEWQWRTEYRKTASATSSTPHNGHPTLVPFTIYRLLFATVGIAHSAPYRAVGIAATPGRGAALRVLARRASPPSALSPRGRSSSSGPGWQNIVWPLQIGWLSASRAASARCSRSTGATAGATSPRASCS